MGNLRGLVKISIYTPDQKRSHPDCVPVGKVRYDRRQMYVCISVASSPSKSPFIPWRHGGETRTVAAPAIMPVIVSMEVWVKLRRHPTTPLAGHIALPARIPANLRFDVSVKLLPVHVPGTQALVAEGMDSSLEHLGQAFQITPPPTNRCRDRDTADGSSFPNRKPPFDAVHESTPCLIRSPRPVKRCCGRVHKSATTDTTLPPLSADGSLAVLQELVISTTWTSRENRSLGEDSLDAVFQ